MFTILKEELTKAFCWTVRADQDTFTNLSTVKITGTARLYPQEIQAKVRQRIEAGFPGGTVLLLTEPVKTGFLSRLSDRLVNAKRRIGFSVEIPKPALTKAEDVCFENGTAFRQEGLDRHSRYKPNTCR